MTDVPDSYRVVSTGFDAMVQAVAPEQWPAPSPCEQSTARDIVAQVVQGHQRVAAGVRGGEPEPLAADQDPTRAWEEVAQAIDEITGDPQAAATMLDGPTGKMPAGEIIGQFVTMDLLVHTWDLSRTIGADECLDHDSVSRAYQALRPMAAMLR